LTITQLGLPALDLRDDAEPSSELLNADQSPPELLHPIRQKVSLVRLE
jgi:hypothetical protein